MCDTFVALPSATVDGSVMFGKNSDREPNEAQSLEYIPAKKYSRGATLQTTYLSIPQVSTTFAALICRPFWMWGAEMGANEKGVVIGNEAVFTRLSTSKKKVLTGMDMLRLSLERAGSAQQAMEIIIALLADFGQGGICGYQDKHLMYHNSFIISDPQEAWVLETAGRLWAAVQVKEYYAISNGLTIGEEFDASHPDLITTAQKNSRLKKGRTFHFAKCYSDWFYTTFSASRKRRQRGMEMLKNKKGYLNTAAAMDLLRDHTQTEYHPDSHFLMQTICAHAANQISRHSAQTTGSFIARLDNENHTFWATGTAAPCTGLYKPIRLADGVIPDFGTCPGEKFDSNSIWWQHEVLHRSVLLDFCPRSAVFRAERNELEKKWLGQVTRAGKTDLTPMTQAAFKQARGKTADWIKKVQQLPVTKSARLIFRRYWNRQNRKAGFPEESIK